LNKILRRTLKILGWTVVSIIVLLLLVVVLIQVPAVQQFAKGKVVAFLESKLKTRVEIGRLSIAFPKKVVLENIYFEDQKKDTLLAGRRLAVDISMFKLIKSEVEINDIELSGIRANIYRKGTDSFFNYDYIVKAFTTPKKTPAPADTSGVKIDIRHVALNEITASFRDDATGSDMYVYLGAFETNIKKFDLDKLAFEVPNLRLERVVARMYQHKPLVEPKTEAEVTAANTGAPELALKLGKLSLKSIDFDYGNDVSAMTARVKLGELLAEPQNLDLPKLELAFKNLALRNTDAVIALGNTPEAHEVEEQVNAGAAAQVSNPWKFSLEQLTLENNHIKFDNNQRPKMKRGIDYAHLDVAALNLDGKNLQFTPSSYSGDIKQFSLQEQSGLNLRELHTSFLYTDHGVSLKDLLVRTDKTIIRDNIEAAWPNMTIDQLAKRPGDILLRINLAKNQIALSDALIFLPDMANQPPFYKNENAVFALNTRIEGKVSDLNIPVFELSGMRNTAVSLRGRMTGLPDPNRSNFNITLIRLNTSEADIAKLAPPGTLPPSIRIPETIAASGTFNGSMNDFRTNMQVRTSRGSADVIAAMRNMNSYDITAGVGALNLGYILKQEANVGRVTAKLHARGAGFDPKTMVANVTGQVFAAEAKGYTYRNLKLDARMNRGDIAAKATMRDENIAFDLDAAAAMKGDYPAVKANLQLDSLNLKKLNLYAKDLRIHGNIQADLPSTNPDDLLGTVDISNLIIFNEGQRYATSDTIHVTATRNEGGNQLSLASEALSMQLKGQYKLTEVGQALQHTINRYYAMPGFKEQSFTPQQWTLDAIVHPSKLLFSFVPELSGTDSINASIAYNSTAEDLKVAVNAPKVVYGTNRVDSMRLRVATSDKLDYALTMNSISAGQFMLNKTSLAGAVANNQLSTALDVKDATDNSRYQLGANLNQTPDGGYRISLAPGLMLDYEKWNVGTDNYIQYGDAGIIIHNFSVENNGQSIAANSVTESPTAPIDVRFTNFDIATITKIAMQDSLLAGGLINGTAQLRNPTTDLTFTSDLQVGNLSYMRDTVGNLSVKVNNETPQTLAADISLLGNGNDIRLNGRYLLSDKTLDMKLDLVNVALATIKPFATGQLDDASGNLRGTMAVSGTIDKPNVNGNIHFDSASVTPTLLGERFALTNEAINVNATGIHFKTFTIKDSSNNTAVIDGDILTGDFKDYRFALNVTADNFQAANARRGPNKPFYGRLNLDTKTRIGGSLSAPDINAYVKINKGTDFAYVLPSNDPEVQSRMGVVEFVDMSSPQDANVFNYPQDSVTKAGARNMNVAAQILTDSAANFHIVIDERNGDQINIRGTAALEAGIDKSGKVNLTGTYTMQEGSYLLTLNFLKRQFYIKSGSTIVWDGDPTQATVDITAIYTANTAPIDLVQHQLAGRSQYEINQYKQKLPFNVLLNMKGELMKPVITFDIELPEREANRLKDVDAKLAQVRADESEMNKQVFALLLLGHFVDENPLASNGTPTTAESFARQSASRILTDQLNRLAGNLIRGVDVTFGVNSGNDYSTGDLAQRTDLTVGLSKRLLNDRLKVNVGSSFGIEGPTAPNQQASNIAGDVSLDYQLSRDGRYVIRAYRENNYEGLVEGQVIETGATFIFRVDYDKFNEFFRRPKKPATKAN
jgi:hypothetical protein